MRVIPVTGASALIASALALALGTPAAFADDYCCICKGKTKGKTFSAADDLTAGAQCSITCRRPTLPRPGACDAPQAPAPEAGSARTGAALLYASDDCTGDGSRVSGSTAKVAAGMRSLMIESGAPVGVWQKADYSGVQLQPVAPGTCISPGWDIGSLKF